MVTVEDTIDGFLYDLLVADSKVKPFVNVPFHRLPRKTLGDLEGPRRAIRQGAKSESFSSFTGKDASASLDAAPAGEKKKKKKKKKAEKEEKEVNLLDMGGWDVAPPVQQQQQFNQFGQAQPTNQPQFGQQSGAFGGEMNPFDAVLQQQQAQQQANNTQFNNNQQFQQQATQQQQTNPQYQLTNPQFQQNSSFGGDDLLSLDFNATSPSKVPPVSPFGAQQQPPTNTSFNSNFDSFQQPQQNNFQQTQQAQQNNFQQTQQQNNNFLQPQQQNNNFQQANTFQQPNNQFNNTQQFQQQNFQQQSKPQEDVFGFGF